MKSVCVLSKDAAQRQTELRELLSQTDKELSDLDHYLEFSKLNACEMWYQGDKRKQVLKKRREVKNELELVAQITKLDEATEKLNKSVDNMMHRKYVPRVLKTTLFKGDKKYKRFERTVKDP